VLATGSLARVALAQAGSGSHETLESFLERHGLDDLAVITLEQQFAQADADERTVIGQKLAERYLARLAAAGTAEERTTWEQKTREVLRNLPEDDGLPLRLAIDKAVYVQAERAAEAYRMGGCSEAEARETGARMLARARDFEVLNADIRVQIRRLESAGTRATGEAASSVTRQADRLEAASTECAYFGAWASYYGGWLTNDVAALNTALSLFAQVLGGQGSEPVRADVTDAMLVYDNLARSVLGTALCLIAKGDAIGGAQWLDMLDKGKVSTAVGAQLPAYRVVALFGADDWRGIEAYLERLRREGGISNQAARVLAAEALRKVAGGGGENAVRLALVGITELAGQGRIDEVTQLAEQFNLSELSGNGDGGFPVAYVLALREFQRAREAHDGDGVTQDERAVRLYSAAQEALEAAATRRDASTFAEAAGQARILAAWTQYYRGRFEAAAKAFSAASTGVDLNAAESAAWMAVVSAEAYQREHPEDEQNSLAPTMMREYLNRFPTGTRAGMVRYRLCRANTAMTADERAEMLAAVEPESEAYVAAQRDLERARYEVVRTALTAAVKAGAGTDFADAATASAARKYAETALPMIRSSFESLSDGRLSAEEMIALVAICRRATAAMLLPGANLTAEATEVLDRLETAAAGGMIDLGPAAKDFDLRRIDLMCQQGDLGGATSRYAALAATAADVAWLAAAQERIAWHLQKQWQEVVGARAGADDVAPPEVRQLAQTTYTFVKPALSQTEVSGAGASKALLQIGGEAALVIWREGKDPTLLAEARQWLTQAIALDAGAPGPLRALARLESEDGHVDRATELWRQLTAALPAGEPDWFDARCNFLECLVAGQQNDRAREVVQQHLMLYPDGGPAPWGERIVAIGQKLGVEGVKESGGGG